MQHSFEIAIIYEVFLVFFLKKEVIYKKKYLHYNNNFSLKYLLPSSLEAKCGLEMVVCWANSSLTDRRKIRCYQ